MVNPTLNEESINQSIDRSQHRAREQSTTLLARFGSSQSYQRLLILSVLFRSVVDRLFIVFYSHARPSDGLIGLAFPFGSIESAVVLVDRRTSA